MQPRRRIEVGRFHQEVVAGGTDGQQVARLQPLAKQVVEHVLRRQVEAQRAVVGGAELVEALREPFVGVGYVLHDVGGEPYFANAGLLVAFENSETFCRGLHSVVHTGEDVAMPVGEILQHAAAFYLLRIRKWPHELW